VKTKAWAEWEGTGGDPCLPIYRPESKTRRVTVVNHEDVVMLREIAILNAGLTMYQIEVSGMIAENKMREHAGMAPAYVEDAFGCVLADCEKAVKLFLDSCPSK